MRLLLLSDLHLDARFLEWGTRARERKADLLTAWREAVNLALSPSEDIHAVLVAGDLFDEDTPQPEVLGRVLEDLGRIARAGKGVVLVPGLYDGWGQVANAYRHAAFPTGVHVFRGGAHQVFSIEAGGETLHVHTGGPFPLGTLPPEVRRGPEAGFHAGLFHAALAPLTGFAPHGLPAWEPDPLAQTGFDLVVLGGGHEPREERSGKTHIVAPGSPVGLRSGEWNERSFHVVDLDDSGSRITTHPVPVRPVREIVVPVEEAKVRTVEALQAHVRAQLTGAALAVVRLTGPAKRGWSPDLVAGALDGGDTVVRVVDETVWDEPPWTKAADEDSVRGHFVRALLPLLDEAGEGPRRRVVETALAAGWRELEGDDHED